MAKNKIIYGGEVLIDLTADTVEASKLLKGYTAHDKAGEIITGTCTFDSNTQDATAALGEVLATKTFYARGQKYTGTMPNNGKVTGYISSLTDVYTIAQGYHDGSGTVKLAATEIAKLTPQNIRAGVTILGVLGEMSGSEDVVAESITVTPRKTSQTVLPSEGYNYISQVVVNATCFTQITVNAIPYVESANAAGGITVTIA